MPEVLIAPDVSRFAVPPRAARRHEGVAVECPAAADRARAADGLDDHRRRTDAIGDHLPGPRDGERGRAAGTPRPGRGLVRVGSAASSSATDCADPHPQEGLPFRGNPGRQNQAGCSGIAAAADVLLSVTALAAVGIDPEPGDRPEFKPGVAPARHEADLIALPGHVVRQRHRDVAAASAPCTGNGRQPDDRSAAAARAAHRAIPDRRGGVTPGRGGVDVDQGQVATGPTGCGGDIRVDHVGLAVPAVCPGHDLGLRAFGGLYGRAKDQRQGGEDRDETPCAVATLLIAGRDGRQTLQGGHRKRVSLLARVCTGAQGSTGMLEASAHRLLGVDVTPRVANLPSRPLMNPL